MLNFLVKFVDGSGDYVTPLCDVEYEDDIIKLHNGNSSLGFVRVEDVKSIVPINLEDRGE